MTDGKTTVIVTGAGGFVGGALVAAFGAGRRFAVRACFRALPEQVPRLAAAFEVGDIAKGERWGQPLAGADVVVHTAARVHVMRDTATDPLAAFRAVNVEGTLKLAREAAAAGARRFVFLSSITVNGAGTEPGRAFTENDVPQPRDAYGRSKLEAEDALRTLAAETGMEAVILRLPLVHGPGAKGNLERLMRLVARGVPLPLGRVDNRRSMIGLDNLVGAVTAVLTHEAAANRTFLVSDQQDLSTPELIRVMGESMGKPARLLPVPVGLLRFAGGVAGRGGEIERLTGSLVVDSSAISEALGWRPAVPPADGIAAMVRAFSAGGA